MTSRPTHFTVKPKIKVVLAHPAASRGMFAPPLEIPLKETITLNNLV
jgi:hypothetical protein